MTQDWRLPAAAIERRAPRAAPSSEIDATRPAIWELASLAGLVGALLFGQQFESEVVYDAFDWVAPLWLMATLFLGALRMVFINGYAIWASLLWFRLATAVYFGFGSLVPLIVNSTSLSDLTAFYAARPDEIYKLNLIVAVSSLTVLSVAATLDALWPRVKPYAHIEESDLTRLAYVVLFGGVGYTVKLLVEVPLSFGAFGSATVPGVVLQFSQLSVIGLYLLSLHAFKVSAYYVPWAVALLLFDIFFGALEFSKYAMILPLIMFLLGWIRANATLQRIAIAAMIVIAVYSLSQPFISFGRDQLALKYGSIGEGSFSDRLEIALRYGDAVTSNPFAEQAESGLMRLSYVNAGCFAISRFDGGTPGPSLDYAFATLIPRFLWPEKPIITDIGGLFNLMATGSANSASAPGYFADAYWSAGWAGVLGFLAAIGVLFTFFSRYAINVLESGRTLHFPLVLLAMKMGLRVDGVLVADIVGASVIWFWGYVAVNLAERPLHIVVAMFEARRRS